jgi:hypothetical protein
MVVSLLAVQETLKAGAGSVALALVSMVFIIPLLHPCGGWRAWTDAGAALLVCNPVSYVDGLLVGTCVPRFVRCLIYRPIYEIKALRWLFRLMQAVPIAGWPEAPGVLARRVEPRRMDMWFAFLLRERLVVQVMYCPSKGD